MKLTEQQINDIKYSCLDDSTKIIQYLEKEKQQQKSYNRIVFITSVAGAIGSIIAAITGIIMLFG